MGLGMLKKLFFICCFTTYAYSAEQDGNEKYSYYVQAHLHLFQQALKALTRNKFKKLQKRALQKGAQLLAIDVSHRALLQWSSRYKTRFPAPNVPYT